MATRTSIGSGLWSAAGTWDTGVPADDDVVVIAAGHTVEFDVDQSSAVTFPNGIQRITINGTLKLTRTAGTYYLKMKAACYITGAGTFDCGAVGDVIPFTAKHTITGGSNWYITGTLGLTVTVYGTEPTKKYVRLSGDEAAGQTVLGVDRSVVGDLWQDGAEIYVCNNNRQAIADKKVIAAGGIAADSITITAPLTGVTKYAGSYVLLITRHIRFVQGNNSYAIFRVFQTDINRLTFYGGAEVYCAIDNSIFTINNGFFHSGVTIINGYSCSNSIINNGVFAIPGGSIFASSITKMTINDGLFAGFGSLATGGCNRFLVLGGIYTSGQYVLNTTVNSRVKNCTFYGLLVPILNTSGFLCENCLFDKSGYGIQDSSGIVINSTFSSSYSGDVNSSEVELMDCLFGSAPMVVSLVYVHFYAESRNHQRITGNLYARSYGGVTTLDSVIYPSGFSSSLKVTLNSATMEGNFRKKILVPAGKSVAITSYLRKPISMAYLPRVWVFEDGYEPFYDPTKIIHEFIMTDSVDTWESESYIYTNSTAYDKMLEIRAVGKNTTSYFNTVINTAFGGGLSRSRLLGGVG